MRPAVQVVQMRYDNPHATAPLLIPVAVVCNTSDEDLEINIRASSARDLKWIEVEEPHDRIAVMVGGGPSVADHLDDIRALLGPKTDIFALNAASQYLTEYTGLVANYQVIGDAKQETAQLVDQRPGERLFASQVHPDCFKFGSTRLWHLEIGNVEAWFPKLRVERGGYALIGGGAAIGNAALCLAFAMGYRKFHLFGYDSCHRDNRSHAYHQPMNQFIPCVDVEWGGKTYKASVAMKAQAEKFQITGQALEQAGCEITLYGEGLLQTMWNTPAENLSERDKYRLMWQFDSYRGIAPGEEVIDKFIYIADPSGLIVDFGCGTGRPALALRNKGYDVFLVDFADNCRDQEALCLPFMEWDLTHPCPVSANYGLCTDVLEHITTDDVRIVVNNIMASARSVFFQISTTPDHWGKIIGSPLHLTVQPHGWWVSLFRTLDFDILWSEQNESSSLFYVSHYIDR